jgi:hypothetical protein
MQISMRIAAIAALILLMLFIQLFPASAGERHGGHWLEKTRELYDNELRDVADT